MSKHTINGLLADAYKAILNGKPNTARDLVSVACRVAMMDSTIPAHKVAAISRALSLVSAI